MRIDTDITTWRGAAAISGAGYTTGIRVTKVVLQVGSGGPSSAGTVAVTKPADSSTLYPTMPVAGATPANTILVTEDVTSPANLTWSDFAVTGATATGTVLYIWWRQ
jgi:hypothetical protein